MMWQTASEDSPPTNIAASKNKNSAERHTRRSEHIISVIFAQHFVESAQIMIRLAITRIMKISVFKFQAVLFHCSRAERANVEVRVRVARLLLRRNIHHASPVRVHINGTKGCSDGVWLELITDLTLPVHLRRVTVT